MHSILIVDDNEQNLYIMRTVLESSGHQVTAVRNGVQALESAGSSPPDIVISDILMPVMDGFALCAQWMRDPQLCAIPFVFYSATYTAADEQALGMSLGAARFIPKPKDLEEFVAIIKDVLREFADKTPGPAVPHSEPEQAQYRLYNEALIRKLESKMLQLESTRRSLEDEIHERKRAEGDLRLHAQVFEQAHEGIVITDANERIITVNRAFCALTNYRESDVVGQTPYMLNSGPHDENFFEEMRRTLVHDGRWSGEVWIRNKSGGAQPVWMSVSTLHDVTGQQTHRIAMFLDISEQKMQAAKIDKLAFFDQITGLPNRALLMDRLEQAVSSAARHNEALAVLFMNLDRFKEINETHGHAAGDLVLREVTRRFTATAPVGQILARFGGDEFVAVGARTDQAAAAFMAEAFVQSLKEPIAIGEDKVGVDVSIGIAGYPLDGQKADELVRNADIAMHRAKMGGQSRLYFRPEMSEQASRRIQMAGKLAAVIDSNGLELHYQPQIQLSTRTLVGAEALVRWKDPEWGWVSPAEFIPLAEERGLIGQLGEWVFKQACTRVGDWRDRGLCMPGRVSINVSARQLTIPDFAGKCESMCTKAGLKPQHFELELTESAAMSDPKQSEEVLQALKQAGFTLAIDDFGVGYASLVYLKRFSAHKLKIDMSFVRGMLDNANDKAIVASIIGMARGLGMRSLAEGVELPDQAAALLALQCDDAQGYLYDRALPPDVFAETWLSQSQKR